MGFRKNKKEAVFKQLEVSRNAKRHEYSNFGSQEIPMWIMKKKIPPRLIAMKSSNIKDNEKILKMPRERKGDSLQRTIVDSSTVAKEAKRRKTQISI